MDHNNKNKQTDSPPKGKKEKLFSGYEVFIIAILGILQFTIILDFMVMSPLGAILLKELGITTKQFGLVVSAYAFSAGGAGLLAAGFADKFDRKKMLLFFYAGFIIGTLLCGMAPTYEFLLIARIVTGIFGGVIGSIIFAIITDMFKMEVRGRVMGVVQMSFASSQILGIPIGISLANHFGWHSPFLMIVGLSIVMAFVIMIYMKPINGHLLIQSEHNAFQHLVKTVSTPRYLRGFAATALLATGGFMLMPFGSAFATNNLGLSLDQLPTLYMITGVFALITGPLVGRLSDKIGKYVIFTAGSLISAVIVMLYCNLGITPLWQVIAINVVMFAGISARMISASALMSGVPEPKDRGAFMGVNSSVQQISGGIASVLAGYIVVQTPTGILERYDVLGYVVTAAIIITIVMMYFINNMVAKNKPSQNQPIMPVPEAETAGV